MEEELKKVNDFRKKYRSVLLKFYKNTSNDVTTHSFKESHTVYFSSSFYIINQKPMMPRTHFHCKPTWVAHSSG